MTRQILLILLGALLLSAAWRYGIENPDEPAVARPPAAAVREPHPGIQPARLDLASLDAARPSMAAGRDPWRFQDPPLRKLTPPKAEPVRVVLPSQPSVPSRPSVPSQPTAAIPKLTLEYLGSFGPRDRRIAVLSDGGRTFNALEGEVLEGRFIVERIGYESVEIRRVGVPGGPAERLGLRRR
jgi:hypothetical protein